MGALTETAALREALAKFRDRRWRWGMSPSLDELREVDRLLAATEAVREPAVREPEPCEDETCPVGYIHESPAVPEDDDEAVREPRAANLIAAARDYYASGADHVEPSADYTRWTHNCSVLLGQLLRSLPALREHEGRDAEVAGLDAWALRVVADWSAHWLGKDHRYGHDFAAFMGERLRNDYDLARVIDPALDSARSTEDRS